VGAVLDDCEAGNRDPKGAGSDLAAIVAAYLTASNRVLFHATERFPAGSTVATLACSDCQIGGFGVGAKPIIAAAAVRTASPVLNVGARMVNVSVHDVEIDAGNVGISCMGMGQGARRVMMLNSTCQGGGGVIGATTPVDNSAAVDEVYINSVSWHGMGAGPCGQEVVYFRGISRLSMLGNDFEGADQTSQSMTRLQSWQKVELGRSYYSRPCAERASIDIRGDVSLQAGAGKVTVDRYANIWQNIHVGNTRSGGGGPGMAVQPQSDATGAPNHYPDGPVEDVLLDGNACWFGITSQQCLGVSSASRVTIRNMVVNAVNRQPGDTVPAVSLSWTRRPEHPQPDHVWAYNNVYDCGVVVGSGNAMFRFQAPYVPGGAKFQNNLQFCATALAAPIYANSTPSSAPVVAGNSDEIDANPMWANGSGSFTLHSDYAVGNPVFKSGVTVPVYFDIAGRPVARTAPMIGAVQ
jgi:hypothetical protein